MLDARTKERFIELLQLLDDEKFEWFGEYLTAVVEKRIEPINPRMI